MFSDEYVDGSARDWDESAVPKILPAYLIIDASGSMIKFEPALNELIQKLYKSLMLSPRVRDIVWLSIITFSGDAQVVLRMTDLRRLKVLPKIGCGGRTFLTRAFDVLRAAVEEDIPALRESGTKVMRPVAFVLTDGYATDVEGKIDHDQWKVAFNRVTDKAWQYHVNVIPFGYGNASRDLLREMKTKKFGFIAAEGDVNAALANAIPALVQTFIITSEHGEFKMPENLKGYDDLEDFFGNE